MLLDAPPTIGHNIQRAVDEIAAANGVSNKVNVPHLLPPPRRPRRRVVAVRQERHPHRARGDAAAAAPRRRSGQTAERGDLPGPPHPRDRRRAHRPRLARRQPLARQHRHPPARPRHADADRHRQPGLGAGLPLEPDRGHPRLHRGAGERARLLVEALHRRPPRPARHARRRDAAPAVHGRHRRELQEGDRQRRSDAATSRSTARTPGRRSRAAWTRSSLPQPRP